MAELISITPDEPSSHVLNHIAKNFVEVEWSEMPTKLLKEVPSELSGQSWVQYAVIGESSWKVELFRPHPSPALDYSDVIVEAEACTYAII